MSDIHDYDDDDGVSQLRAEVEVLKTQLTQLTGLLADGSPTTPSAGDAPGGASQRTDRRDLLKVAGSATIGAVGASLLKVGSAAALTLSWDGIYRGVCSDNQDPEQLGRITVRVPTVYGNGVSGWALPSLPPGWTELPAVGDQVWVVFEGGRSSYPVWLGVFDQRVPTSPT
jgi:hypothetical protein